jgi:hypothetical protein
LEPSFLYGFYGSLDDIAIWNRQLTSCEIESIFYGPHPLFPVISQADTTLSTDTVFSSYQWIKNDSIVPGATNSSYATTSGIYEVAVTTPGGCMDTSAAYTPTLGIHTIMQPGDVSIFPNPSASIFYIQSPYPVDVILTNMEGNIVKKLEKTSQFDLKNLPNGSYLVQIFDANWQKIRTQQITWLGD